MSLLRNLVEDILVHVDRRSRSRPQRDRIRRPRINLSNLPIVIHMDNGIKSVIAQIIDHNLFQLATHYWEGRWLLAMDKALPALQRVQQSGGRGGNDRSMAVPMWSRRMMLTPCAVSTFATLPRKMTCRDNASGSYRIDSIQVQE